MSDGASLLRSLMTGGGRDPNQGEEIPRLDDTTLISRLLAAQERYASGCPFAVRSIVTPRAEAPLPGAGRPCVVIEVFDPPIIMDRKADSNAMGYQGKVDIRVLHEIVSMDGANSAIVTHCYERWMFEPYTGPKVVEGAVAN